MKALYRQTITALLLVPRPVAAAVDMDLHVHVPVPRLGDNEP